MGAWGAESFSNDDAMDWLAELIESEDQSLVREALVVVAEAGKDDYPDLPNCCCALAAAELICMAKGLPPDDFPDEAETWLEDNPIDVDEALVDLARVAVERIESGSELRDLWAESESKAQWHGVIKDLKDRLLA